MVNSNIIVSVQAFELFAISDLSVVEFPMRNNQDQVGELLQFKDELIPCTV